MRLRNAQQNNTSFGNTRGEGKGNRDTVTLRFRLDQCPRNHCCSCPFSDAVPFDITTALLLYSTVNI